jgi:tripartite-type tricarboxylate transporter receptor subunit TctC
LSDALDHVNQGAHVGPKCRWLTQTSETLAQFREGEEEAMLSRRELLSTAGSAALLALGSSAARSQDTTDWPTRPVQLIVNFPAGSTTDYAARLFAERLSREFGQQFFIKNRAGASGLLGIGAAVKSPADGYTFLVTPAYSAVIVPHLMRTTAFDPFKDLVPVTQFVDAALLVAVHPSVPANSVQELVTFAMGNPGKLNWGTSGTGSTTHLLYEAFKLRTEVHIFHVPYKSGSAGLPDFLAGVVHIHSDPNALPHVAAGKAKLLAILDRSRRPDFSDVPLLKEIYPELDYLAWLAVFAPAGTPRPIVQRMSEEMNTIARDPELRPLLLYSGLAPYPGTPEELFVLMRTDYDRYGRLIRQMNLRRE